MFFDNLEVIHNRGALLEETHYYPFGLTMAGISSRAAGKMENKRRYNGYEENKTFDLNLYESFYRLHDPQLGRFWQVDPKPNDMESVYAAMGNNPVLNMDPLGDTIPKDNNNYRADYLPVFNSGSVLKGVNNAVSNVGAFLWNGTLGAMLETSKALGNGLAGMINGDKSDAPSLMASIDQWQDNTYRYHTRTPLRQQGQDFLAAATDLRSYEVLPPMVLGYRVLGTLSTSTQGVRTGAGMSAAEGGSFGEKLFLSERFGITSEKFGSSAAYAQGSLNKAGGSFKAGWSTGQNSAGQWGYKFRIGLGLSPVNPNNAKFHIHVPNSFVPNSFANPSIQVKRSLFNLSLKP